MQHLIIYVKLTCLVKKTLRFFFDIIGLKGVKRMEKEEKSVKKSYTGYIIIAVAIIVAAAIIPIAWQLGGKLANKDTNTAVVNNTLTNNETTNTVVDNKPVENTTTNTNNSKTTHLKQVLRRRQEQYLLYLLPCCYRF